MIDRDVLSAPGGHKQSWCRVYRLAYYQLGGEQRLRRKQSRVEGDGEDTRWTAKGERQRGNVRGSCSRGGQRWDEDEQWKEVRETKILNSR